MSDPIDASMHDGTGDSTDATAPTKPSLRVIEPGSTSHATREEDLANGPLLLGLGNGHDDPIIPDPEWDLDSQHRSNLQLEGSVLPLPLRLPEVLPMGSMTVSSTSQSGTSLSLPPRSTSSANQPHPSATGNVWSEIKALLEELQERSAARHTWTFPSSLPYEFSWQNSTLRLGTEPVNLVRTTDNQSSRVSLGTECTMSTINEPIVRLTNPGFAADNSFSHAIAGIGGEHWSAAASTSSEPYMEIAVHETASWIAELLVDNFLRSYAHKGSRDQTAGASQKDIGPVSGNHTGTISSSSGRPGQRPVSHKRKAVGDDERSDDEDAQGKKPTSTGTGKPNSPPRWACPFAQWRPTDNQYVKTCIDKFSKGPSTIKSLKEHIRNIHVKDHCGRCWAQFSSDHTKSEHPSDCNRNTSCKPPPRGLVTLEMQEKIFVDESSSVSHVEQWYRIYEILFPEEQRCHSPYFNKAAVEHLAIAEMVFRSETSQDLLRSTLQEHVLDPELRRRLEEAVRDEYTARVFQMYDPSDKSMFTPAQSRSETAQYSQTRILSTKSTATEAGLVQDDLHRPRSRSLTPDKLDELVSAGVITLDQQASTGDSTPGVDTSNDSLSFLHADEPWFGAEPAESGNCQDAKFDADSEISLEDLFWHKKYEQGGDQVDEVSNA